MSQSVPSKIRGLLRVTATSLAIVVSTAVLLRFALSDRSFRFVNSENSVKSAQTLQLFQESRNR